MADSDVEIKISGDATGAQRAFKDTAEAAQAAVGTVNSAFEGLGAVFDAMRDHLGAITAVLAGGAAFKEAINATKEFTGNVTQLAKQAGISAQEASGLNVALEDIGSSADTYTGALSKLTRQVRQNEAGLNAMGIATRDSNGQYLDGRALMDSAITTLNTYKEGTDRNLAAQVAFGKGAAESAALLKLNTQVQEEGARKAEELNLVIGPGTQAAVKGYKMAMNDVGDVMTGFEVTLGKAIMPVLTDLATWFSSAGPAAIAIFKPAAAGIADALRIVVDVVKELWTFFSDAFSAIGQLLTETTGTTLTFSEFVRNAFAVVGIALLLVKEGFQLSFEGIRVSVMSVIGVLHTFAEVARMAFARDFSGAKAAWKAGLADIETEVSESTKRILKIRADAAAAMDKLAMGDGYKRPEDGDSKVAKPTGSRSFTESKDDKASGPTLMARYEAELATKKLAIDQQNALDGTFYSMSKAAEAEFWASKLATVDKASKEYPQIDKKRIEALLQQNKDAFDATIASMQKQQEAIKYDYDAKLAIGEQEVVLLRQKYGEKSKEVEKGEEALNKLRQARTEQQIKLQNQQTENDRAATVAQIDLEEQHAQAEVALMQRTEAQLLQDQQQFEMRRNAVQLAALNERMALAAGEDNRVEQAKIYGQIEALKAQHEQKMLTISTKSAMDQSQLSRGLYANMQQGFSSVVSGALQGTLNMKTVMQQTYSAIADTLAQAVTKMVTNWLIGELTKTAATKAANAEQIQAAAGEAAANAYNAIVGIPYVGPFLAPAAAAVAYAGVMAFASAEGGYDIPGGVNPMVQTHAREMILPAELADRVRAVTPGDGNSAGGSGGGDTFHIHVIDQKGMKKLLRENGPAIADSMRTQRRNFNPAARA